MGVEPYNFVSALNCVMAQRLVRVLCPRCKRPAEAADALLRESGLDPDVYQDQVFYDAAGLRRVRRHRLPRAAPRWRSCSTCRTASAR